MLPYLDCQFHIKMHIFSSQEGLQQLEVDAEKYCLKQNGSAGGKCDTRCYINAAAIKWCHVTSWKYWEMGIQDVLCVLQRDYSFTIIPVFYIFISAYHVPGVRVNLQNITQAIMSYTRGVHNKTLCFIIKWLCPSDLNKQKHLRASCQVSTLCSLQQYVHSNLCNRLLRNQALGTSNMQAWDVTLEIPRPQTNTLALLQDLAGLGNLRVLQTKIISLRECFGVNIEKLIQKFCSVSKQISFSIMCRWEPHLIV